MFSVIDISLNKNITIVIYLVLESTSTHVNKRAGYSAIAIGYTPGVKVLKVTEAINNNEITNMSLLSVKYQYVFSISSFKYFAIVTISKKGRWAKNRDNYKYNETI